MAIAAVLALAVFGAAPALAATAGQPTGVMVTAGNGGANVYFTAPSSNGGSQITQYTVTASPGGMTASGTSSPVGISGLLNGTSYTFTVTALNAGGPGVPSNPSAPATPLAPPAVVFDPVVLGSSAVGQTLFATSGTWTESAHFSYQWLDCDQVSGNCFGVAGAASGPSYTVSPLDGGYTIAVVVTAVNADNELGSDTSAPTLTVLSTTGAPVVQSAPGISAANASAPVSATTGTWSGSPISYSYAWYACSPLAGSCHAVTALSSILSSYNPVGDENGDFLKVAVVATNAFGSSVPAFSGSSGTVAFPQPTISISWPADGSDYYPSAVAGSTNALYSCSASGGSTIVSCIGTVAAGSAVPFTPGSHAFTVTATDSAGQSATRTVNYSVGGSPAITLTGPANGATYTQGTSLSASATCVAFDGSSLPCAIQQSPQPSCQAQVALVGCANASQPAGTPALDSQTLGRHTVTVTTSDAFGEGASLTVGYTIIAGPPSVTAGPEARVSVTRLSQASTHWRIGAGTRFSFTPNVAAVVTFAFERNLKGRRAAGRCVAQTPGNRHEQACTLAKRVGSLKRFEPAGADVVPFNGRLGSLKLAPGSYTVQVSAAAIGETSPVLYTAGTLTFTITG